MPANTTDGWPYILPADHPLDDPGQSQALANLLDSRWDTYQSTAVMTPAAGWADNSGGGLLLTKFSGMVTGQRNLKPTTDTSVTVTPIVVATLPVGFRPAVSGITAGIVSSAGAFYSCRFALDGNGNVRLNTFANVSVLATNGYAGCLFTYRGA